MEERGFPSLLLLLLVTDMDLTNNLTNNNNNCGKCVKSEDVE